MKDKKPLAVGDRRKMITIAEYDENFHDVLKIFKWRVSREGTNKYAKTSLPRLFGGTQIRMHHMIMYWLCGHRRIRGREIDHIDGNGLNNRISNLRFVTPAQNRMNMKKAWGRYQYKGIHKSDQDGDFWCARITKNGKKINLGTFNSQREAALAYNRAAIKHHGKYARLNEV